MIVDLDATLITSHSDKEEAKPTFKRGYGFHPLAAFVDHGPGGTGEPVSMTLRPGNVGSNTAADHISVTREALKQLPGIDASRPGRKILIRTDGGGDTREFVNLLAKKGGSYSIGYTLPVATPDIYQIIPETAWQPAVNAGGEPGPKTGPGSAKTPAWPTYPCTASPKTGSGARWSCSRSS